MDSNTKLDVLDQQALQPLERNERYAAKTEIAKSAAITAASLIEKGFWMEAYFELHAAARVCWERRKVQPPSSTCIGSDL